MHFNDFTFPAELYQRKTGNFSSEIQELLNFTPILLNYKTETNEKPKTKSKVPGKTKYFSSQILDELWFVNLMNYMKHPKPKFIIELRDNSMKQKEEKDSIKKDKKYTDTAIAISAASVSLFSVYKYSQKDGEIKFMNNLVELIDSVQNITTITNLWISERKSMGFHVPPLVAEDLQKLEFLVDNLRRLDYIPEKLKERNSFGLLALFGGIIAMSMWIKARALKYLGIGGLFASLLNLAFHKGAYSSLKYKLTNDMLIKRALYICESLNNDCSRRMQMINDWSYDI
jgi:hypothetical protein